jgi:hypothetical protein
LLLLPNPSTLAAPLIHPAAVAASGAWIAQPFVDGSSGRLSMTRLTRFVVCAAALFLGATRASADPVRLISGSLLVVGASTVAPISTAGTRGFSVNGLAAPSEGRIDPFTECAPCLPGSTVSVGGSLGEAAFLGTVTFEGSTFPLLFSINNETSLLFEWSGTTIAPPPAAGPVGVTAPFTLSGLFFRSFGRDVVELSGRGTASLFLTPANVGPDVPFAWEVDRVRYDFEDPALTPEPATLMLTGIGVVAGAAARRRRCRELRCPTRPSVPRPD